MQSMTSGRPVPLFWTTCSTVPPTVTKPSSSSSSGGEAEAERHPPSLDADLAAAALLVGDLRALLADAAHRPRWSQIRVTVAQPRTGCLGSQPRTALRSCVHETTVRYYIVPMNVE